ncbi:MAG UNVERIFIED_CONTAM: hypothetical protein LVQ98_08885, partial [Rickettsiaceae bacterium]
MDISTADFNVTSIALENFASELSRINPKEIIISE